MLLTVVGSLYDNWLLLLEIANCHERPNFNFEAIFNIVADCRVIFFAYATEETPFGFIQFASINTTVNLEYCGYNMHVEIIFTYIVICGSQYSHPIQWLSTMHCSYLA